MRLLQVALDLLDLDQAVDIALQVVDYVDFIEAGTPLIKKNGLYAVEKLSEECGKPVVADMKTMDTGYLEASIAYEAGATYTTVLGVAGLYTIKEALRARDNYKRGLIIDSIGLDDVEAFLIELERHKLDPDYILLHSGIDMQSQGIMPFKWLERMSKFSKNFKFAVAGGINLSNVEKLREYKYIELVIVGGGITKADDPRDAARRLKEVLATL